MNLIFNILNRLVKEHISILIILYSLLFLFLCLICSYPDRYNAHLRLYEMNATVNFNLYLYFVVSNIFFFHFWFFYITFYFYFFLSRFFTSFIFKPQKTTRV